MGSLWLVSTSDHCSKLSSASRGDGNGVTSDQSLPASEHASQDSAPGDRASITGVEEVEDVMARVSDGDRGSISMVVTSDGTEGSNTDGVWMIPLRSYDCTMRNNFSLFMPDSQ